MIFWENRNDASYDDVELEHELERERKRAEFTNLLSAAMFKTQQNHQFSLNFLENRFNKSRKSWRIIEN